MPFECTNCGILGARLIFALDIRLCKSCKTLFKYRLISKTRALENYKLKKQDLEGLGYIEVGNPLYRNQSNMLLYREKEIINIFINKYFNNIGLEDRNYLENLTDSIDLEYKNVINRIVGDILQIEQENKKKNINKKNKLII